MSATPTSVMPRLLILLSALGVVGCGDSILCESSPLVMIQSPTSTLSVDVDPVAAGVQTDVRVRSTLLVDEPLELIVLDGSGTEVQRVTKPADVDGAVVFSGVTVPAPHATLHAVGKGACGSGEDEVKIEVIAGSGCELKLEPAPRLIAAYPVGVLNAADDPDPAPGFQAAISVTTLGGWSAELFATTGQGEQSVGKVTADAMGIVRFAQTFADGPVSLRAVCSGAGEGEVSPSAAVSAFIDTTPPACDFTSPAPGSSITPNDDQDGDLGNGVQLGLEASVAGGDAEGEAVELTITSAGGSAMVPMSPVDAAGRTSATVTLAPPTTPASFQLGLSAHDRAGNACTSTRFYDVVYDGCSIDVIAPTATVTADADNVPANGSQVDIQLAVAPLCIGRTVTATCGLGAPQGVVPATGPLTLRADLCGSSPCQTQATCTFHVSSPAGIQTQTSATIAFDNQGPPVAVQVVQPAIACGAQITSAADADPVAPGVQLVARVFAAGGVNPSIELTNIGGTTSVPAPVDTAITLAPGLNLLSGVAFDSLGNRGQSPQCFVTLADIGVAFSGPAADGLVGRSDGTIAGGALTFPLCGTVDRAGTAVTVQIDGGPALPATVTGNGWCRTVTLAEAPHSVVVLASKGPSFGTAALPLGVDLTPPGAVTAFTANAPTRQRIELSWTAPGDGGAPVARYLAKVSTSPLTEASFDTQGSVLATNAPRAPGSAERVELTPVRTGTPYWIGIASVDKAGNRAAAAIAGPITPTFDQTPAILGPNLAQGSLALGAAIAHGKFNDDEFDDLAVAAPTQNAGGLTQAGAVYVYFGGPGGITATPQLTILGGAVGALAGSGLAAVRWSSAFRDDLVIGAPGANGGDGRLFVFAGGAGFPAGTISASSAALQIGASATAPGWFVNGGLGAAVVAADIDGDGMRDLVASAIRGGGTGGIVTLYGGTVTSSVALSDTDTSGFGTAVVEYLPDPLALAGHKFGTYLHAVEPTRGPLDTDDDLVVGYQDDASKAGDSVYVIRGNGTRPSVSLTRRPFIAGRDVRIDLVTAYTLTEFGSQAISVEDLNGDGAAELVISAYRNLNGAGQVLIIDGATMGTGGVARTTDPGVVLATIQGAAGTRTGAVLVARDALSSDDVDGDGRRDLLVGSVTGGVARLYVWFGGALPLGTTTVGTAGTSIIGPPEFGFNAARPQGPAGQAIWAGDLNGDGLDDVCWASPYDNSTMLDGAFAVLTDGLGGGG